MYNKIRKIVMIILFTLLFGSSFTSFNSANAEDLVVKTGSVIELPDYVEVACHPVFKVEKNAGKIVNNPDGTYSVDYTIIVSNNGSLYGTYTLIDEIELPQGVEAVVGPVVFTDDEMNPVPVVNLLFNGDDETTIIAGEFLEQKKKDIFNYTVIYSVDFNIDGSPFNCENETNFDDIVIVENFASVGKGNDESCIELNIPEAGSIYGYKWNDENNNGNYDCNKQPLIPTKPPLFCENKLENWEITIEGISYSGSTFTGTDGYYSFENIPLGKYKVCEVQQKGWTQTFPGKDGCHYIYVDENTEEEQYNFGNYEVLEVEIIADKIICDNESDLPNWGEGGDNIDKNTVENFLEENENCKSVKGWEFQWGNSTVSNPGDEFYGEADEGWNTFEHSAIVNIEDIEQIRVREVLEEGFIPFTYGPNGNTNEDNVSAEMYCHTDVKNYDNFDVINLDHETETYYCVAFNYEIPMIEEVEPQCEDETRYAKITLNEGSGGLDTEDNYIWFGDKVVPVGGWFVLPNDVQTSSHTEGVIMTYDNNVITIDLLHREDNERQDFAGTIEFYGARVPGNVVEGRDLDISYKLEANDSIVKASNTVINFDFQVTTANDEGSMTVRNKIEYCHDPFRIVARKIVCEDESELPNNFGGDVDEIKWNTAQNWVNEHDSCELVEGWSFEYGLGIQNMSWTTFGPTNSNGRTVFSTRDLEDISLIKVREVEQEGFIPFSNGEGNEPEYSAEIYCGTDVTNYDNEEWIKNPKYGQTVQCVAWNVPNPPEPLTVCENTFSVNNEKDLSIIDLVTGNQTYVNDLEFGSSAAAVNPVTGNVYYIEGTISNARVGVYNITDHSNTVIGNTGEHKVFVKLAFNIDGVLYAMTQDGNLYTISTINGEAAYVDKTPKIDRRGGDITFDDQGDLYVMVKDGKLFRVVVTANSTAATFLGQVKYNGSLVQTTGLVFKNELFYATDNLNRLYSFDLNNNTIGNVIRISNSTNKINDLASCPVEIKITSGDIILCKMDEEENSLEGWNLQLLGEHIEKVIVPTNTGLPVYSSDLDEGNYVLIANSFYNYGNGGRFTDANFSQREGINDSWTNVNDFSEPHKGWLGIMVNNDTTNWSNYFATNHKYGLGYENFSGTFDFRVLDDQYIDNVGNLTVDIYEGYAGTTGKNGCVTFENVPFGEYVIDETLEIDWENLDGLGEVLFNEENDLFNVVNKNTNVPEFGSVSVFKFNDRDEDGYYDGSCGGVQYPDSVQVCYSDEWGLEGWEMMLSNSGITYTGVTMSDGYVTFDDVLVGEYTLCEVQQEGWIQTYPAENECHSIIVEKDGEEEYKFGNHEQEFAGIYGYKFNDLNEDGEWQDDTEGTFSGWTITLSGEGYTGSTTTNENGYYFFEDILVGEYTLCEVNQTGYIQTYPIENKGCHIVYIGDTADEGYDFGNYKDTATTPTDGGGGRTVTNASCESLEVTTSIGTSEGVVELTCNGSYSTAMFMLDCGDGTSKQINAALGLSDKYATFTCNYDTTDSYTPVCSVSTMETNDTESSLWTTSDNTCELEVDELITFEVEEEIVAGGENEEEEIIEESDVGGGIDNVYNDYTNKKKTLQEIQDAETQEGASSIVSPTILLKTGTPINERVKIINDNRVELYVPDMNQSYTKDINIWKGKLVEEDRNRTEYIVIPSNGLIVPVNYVPTDSKDYGRLIDGNDINANLYLKTGVMSYPGTSVNNYGEVGNKVIFGHSSYWKFDNGRYKTHFQKIIELDVGEEIWVYKIQSDGTFKRFVYEVNASFETVPTNVGILEPGKGSNLTLITCTPIGGIEGRWIVQAKFVNEDKAELEEYLYGENVSAKYRVAIAKFLNKLESLERTSRERITLEIFSKIEGLEQNIQNNEMMSDLLKYFKLKLAISYKSIY